MAYLATTVTSSGEVLAIDFDEAEGIFTIVYLSSDPHNEHEQLSFPAEDAEKVFEMLDAAQERLRGRD